MRSKEHSPKSKYIPRKYSSHKNSSRKQSPRKASPEERQVSGMQKYQMDMLLINDSVNRSMSKHRHNSQNSY